jgi:hypothetical protein
MSSQKFIAIQPQKHGLTHPYKANKLVYIRFIPNIQANVKTNEFWSAFGQRQDDKTIVLLLGK